MSDYTPVVGHRVRVVLEGEVTVVEPDEPHFVVRSDDGWANIVRDFRTLERLPDPEPAWQPGDVVLDAEGWCFTRRDPTTDAYSEYPWIEGAQKHLHLGDWAKDRQVTRPVTPLVRGGKPWAEATGGAS